jgi:hypothetical protein
LRKVKGSHAHVLDLVKLNLWGFKINLGYTAVNPTERM